MNEKTVDKLIVIVYTLKQSQTEVAVYYQNGKNRSSFFYLNREKAMQKTKEEDAQEKIFIERKPGREQYATRFIIWHGGSKKCSKCGHTCAETAEVCPVCKII